MFGIGKKEIYTVKIEGMSCSHCSGRVEKALQAIPGVKAKVNLDAAEAVIEAPAKIGLEKLKKVIEEAGYSVL